MTGIMLAATPPSFDETVRRAYGAQFNGDLRHFDDVGELTGPEEMAKRLAAADPDVVAIGSHMPLDMALAVVHALDRQHPETTIVLVATPSAELWQRAVRAGARDIVAPDASIEAVMAAFDHVLETARCRRQALAGNDAPSTPQSRIITVLSPKGGSGKTVVSTNVSVALARQMPGRVVLVDLDLRFGDVATALHQDPQYTMAHAVAVPLDSTVLKAFLTPHSSELLTLCAPVNPEEADDITPEAATRVIKELARAFPYVIVDTGAGLDDATLAAVEISTDLILVSSTDVPSVRSLRKEVQILDRLGITAATRHFVLNRADAQVGLVSDDIEATTGLKVSITVPSTRSIPTAVNQGIPLVELEPKSTASRNLQVFAQTLLPSPHRSPGERRSTGLFRRNSR